MLSFKSVLVASALTIVMAGAASAQTGRNSKDGTSGPAGAFFGPMMGQPEGVFGGDIIVGRPGVVFEEEPMMDRSDMMDDEEVQPRPTRRSRQTMR